MRSQGLEVRVWRDYEKFIAELSDRFPHERQGIRKFYDECWRVRVASCLLRAFGDGTLMLMLR